MLNKYEAAICVENDEPTLFSLAFFWFVLMIGCGSFGLAGFAGFYIYVIGIEDAPIVFDGLVPMFIIILMLVTFLEVFYQAVCKSSLMKNIGVAVVISSFAAVTGAIIQFSLPMTTRHDVLSGLLGFDERHFSALACEYTAATIAVAGGILGFVVVRHFFRRFNWAY